ncbi:MAG: hypothetical protein AAGA77_15225 [Bacteroidota bacterium]
MNFLWSAQSNDFELNTLKNYALDHPFSADRTNLLPQVKITDKSIPSRLTKYDIWALVDSLMLKRNYQFVKDTFLTIGEFSIPISSYDPKAKIGYVWMDYNRFGKGIEEDRLIPIKSQQQCENDFLKLLDDGMELLLDDEERFLQDVFGIEDEEDEVTEDSIEVRVSGQRVEQFIFGDAKEMTPANIKIPRSFVAPRSILNSWKFFGNTLNPEDVYVQAIGEEAAYQLESMKSFQSKKEYMETLLIEFRKNLEVKSLASIKQKSILDNWKLSAAEMIKEPLRFLGFVSRIDQLGIIIRDPALYYAMESQVFQLEVCDDRKEWWKHSMAILDLFNVNRNPSLKYELEYQQLLGTILSSSQYTMWEKRYAEIKALDNVRSISLRELEALDDLAFEKGIFIAPVSILDNRMIYDMDEEGYQNQMDSLRRQIKVSKSKEERKKLLERLKEKNLYRTKFYNKARNEAKQKSLQVIQQDFDVFLDWAEEEVRKRRTRV